MGILRQRSLGEVTCLMVTAIIRSIAVTNAENDIGREFTKHLRIIADNVEGCVTLEDLLYDPPSNFVNPPSRPVLVHLSVALEKVTTIDEELGGATIYMHVEAEWEDLRLLYHLNATGKRTCHCDFAVGDIVYIRNIWTPTFFFPSVHKVTLENSPYPDVSLSMDFMGKVKFRQKYTVITPCYMNLRDFPMDKADCVIAIFDISRDSRRVEYRWNSVEPLVSILPSKTAQHFLMYNATTLVQSQERNIPINTLYLRLVFQRIKVWYLLQAYTPSYLIILISWLYNTMGLETRTSRLQLRASLLLALMLLFSNIHRQIPRVGYVKALDVWLLMILGFLILSCIEDTIVTYLCNHIRHPRYKVACDSDQVEFKFLKQLSEGFAKTAAQPLLAGISGNPESVGMVSRRLQSRFKAKRHFRRNKRMKELNVDRSYNHWAKRIDSIFIVLYPTLFIAANIAYWCHYTAAPLRVQ